MLVEAVALSDFVHGDITAIEGKLIRHRNGGLVERAIAEQLERAGLVRIRTVPVTPRAPEGKPLDDGLGRPSSASPPAPVSQPPTSATLSLGSVKTRKSGV